MLVFFQNMDVSRGLKAPGSISGHGDTMVLPGVHTPQLSGKYAPVTK